MCVLNDVVNCNVPRVAPLAAGDQSINNTHKNAAQEQETAKNA